MVLRNGKIWLDSVYKPIAAVILGKGSFLVKQGYLWEPSLARKLLSPMCNYQNCKQAAPEPVVNDICSQYET